MSKIKNFNQFVAIYELDTSGTYLDVKRTKKSEQPEKETELQKLTAKAFKSAPKTEGNPFGFKFEMIDSNRSKEYYKVIFPDDFFEHFKIEDKSFWNWLLGGNKKKNLKLKTSDVEVLMKYNRLDLKRYSDSIMRNDKSNLPEINLTVKEMLDDRVILEIEKKFNRIHFPGGIPKELSGIGLGYIIYEEFIKFLGIASSDEDQSSDDAKRVWSKIATDPDFYCLMVYNNNDYVNSKILAISKSHKILSTEHRKKLDSIINAFIKEHLLSFGKETKLRVDDELVEKLPYLNNWKAIYEKGFSLEDWSKELDTLIDKLIQFDKGTNDLTFNQAEKMNQLISTFVMHVFSERAYNRDEVDNSKPKFKLIHDKLIRNFYKDAESKDRDEISNKFKLNRIVGGLNNTINRLIDFI